MALFSKNTPQAKPPFEGLYAYAFILFLGFAIADLSILKIRPLMLPDKAPPAKPRSIEKSKVLLRSSYRLIEKKNIFTADSEIPKALGASEKEDNTGSDGPATKTRLPIQLLGTIVHANPKKSVATISLKNKNKAESVKVDEEIPSLLEVLLIERRKVTFRNINNSRKEYVEIADDAKINFGTKVSVPKKVQNGEVAQVGKTEFEVERSDIEKYTSNLSQVLKQARMLPNTVNGEVKGFRFVSIQPDSIYTKLGFKVNDVIMGVNGEEVNSPSKAMELYKALQSSNDLKLSVKRNGKEEEFRYTIK